MCTYPGGNAQTRKSILSVNWWRRNAHFMPSSYVEVFIKFGAISGIVASLSTSSSWFSCSDVIFNFPSWFWCSVVILTSYREHPAIQTLAIVNLGFWGEISFTEIMFWACTYASHNCRSFMLSIYMVVSDTSDVMNE